MYSGGVDYGEAEVGRLWMQTRFAIVVPELNLESIGVEVRSGKVRPRPSLTQTLVRA
jgi:hypothetical protein